MSADFHSPPTGSTHKCMSGGKKEKSADVKQKTVMLIYPDPNIYSHIVHALSLASNPVFYIFFNLLDTIWGDCGATTNWWLVT